MVLHSSLSSFVTSTRLIWSEDGAISPVKVLNNMIHPKSLKKFFSRHFDGLSLKNSHFWYFQGLYKQFCLYKS